jgi:hypothetical protein
MLAMMWPADFVQLKGFGVCVVDAEIVANGIFQLSWLHASTITSKPP